MKKIIGLIILLVLVSSCGVKEEEKDYTTGEIDGIKYEETTEVSDNIKIQMANGDIILLELYPDIAPITVENFQKLIQEKFYSGSTFHRVMKGFMIQGGRNKDGKEADTIKGEFLNNGFDNYLNHDRGVISMARKGNDMDSASSEFFIVHQKTPSLDRDYASFGKVIAGMSIVDKIASTPVDSTDANFPVPLSPQVIKSITFINILD